MFLLSSMSHSSKLIRTQESGCWNCYRVQLALLVAQQANKSGDEVLRQGVTTLFEKPADREDGGQGSPKNHLILV